VLKEWVSFTFKVEDHILAIMSEVIRDIYQSLQACTAMMNWLMKLVEKEVAWEITVHERLKPSATLSITNLIWLDHELNVGHHGEKPVVNSLSYGATQ
jgi:hypothetical protein